MLVGLFFLFVSFYFLERSSFYAKTTHESIFFTLVTAWMMVYGMTHNPVRLSASSRMPVFLALKEMAEYILIALCAYFRAGAAGPQAGIPGRPAGDRPFASSCASRSLLILCQVALASILAVWAWERLYGPVPPRLSFCLLPQSPLVLPLQILLVKLLACAIPGRIRRRGRLSFSLTK